MLRRSFLELPIFSFFGFKLKDKIEPEVKQEIPEIWEHKPVERLHEIEQESLIQIEAIVLDWLKNTKESMIEIPMIRGDLHPTFILFFRSVINIKSAYNTWEQWHIATCRDFDKIISVRIKEIGVNNTKLIDDGFTMPNEVRTERYDGTDATSYV